MSSVNSEQFLCVVTAFLVSVLTTRYLTHPDSKLQILDIPNNRSLHSLPVPRTGGVAILLGVAVSLGMLAFFTDKELRSSQLSIVLSVAIVAVISFLDDWQGLPALPRFTSHVVSASIVVFNGFALESIQLPGIAWQFPEWVSWVLTVPFIVWFVNLYNFMDGMDGFAGGMAIIGFGTLSLIGYMNGEQTYALVTGCVAASAGGFLVFNFPPARIFMGDAGSSVLGFLAAFAILWGSRVGILSFWVSILVFSPFVIDASVTLFRRLWNCEKIWQAHKSHYYQRLVGLGWSHKKTVLSEYALMICCSVTAIVVTSKSASNGVMISVFCLWLLVYIGLISAVNRMEKG